MMEESMSVNAVEVIMAENSQAVWHQVCDVGDLVANGGVCALLEGQQVAIFHLADLGETYAIQNYDPFSKANVLSRGLTGDLDGQLVVASPIYKQHFNLRTGQCLEDEAVQLQIFPSKIVNNKVEIAFST
jgi:NAD(P)H-dependent nitrite reductase small subunit